MKRATRVKIMLIVLFACIIYWMKEMQGTVGPELLPTGAPSSDAAPGGPQEVWPADDAAAIDSELPIPQATEH